MGLYSSNRTPVLPVEVVKKMLACAAYAHFTTPRSLEGCYDWLHDKCLFASDTMENVGKKKIIELAGEAKNPFQFIYNVFRYRNISESPLFIESPKRMDASSSAYQIMSYFLLDKARSATNKLTRWEEREYQGSLLITYWRTSRLFQVGLRIAPRRGSIRKT